MHFETISSLVYNASLLLVMSLVSTNLYFGNSMNAGKRRFLVGLLNGVLCSVIMLNPIYISSGLIIDARSILLGATAMFFGVTPAVLAFSFVVVTRILIGGIGTIAGIVGAIIYLSLGLIWHKYRLSKLLSRDKKTWLEFYVMGVILNLGLLISLLATPSSIYATTFSEIGIPTMIVYPIGTLLISMVILTRMRSAISKDHFLEDLKERELKYRTLFHEFVNREALLKSLIDSIPDLVFYKDKNSVYLGCNSAFERFSGKNSKNIIGSTDHDLFDKPMADLFISMDKEMLSQSLPKINEELVNYPDGREVILETLKTPYYDSENKVIGLIGISRDITDRKKKEEEILYLTYHDVLTGIYNRNYFEQALRDFNQSEALPLSVLLCDLNGLKLINDAFGHSAGDKLLVEAAQILQKHCRVGDILSRTGGDEFCIFMPNTDSTLAHMITIDIEESCREMVSQIYPFSFSLAIGYATKTRPDEQLEVTLKTAENFMYKKKLLDYKSTHNSIISSITATMFEKSHETQEHAERLAELSVKLGEHLGLKGEELVELELFAMLHDIGKIGVEERILSKNGKLSDDEWIEIQKHPEIGYRITHASSELRHISHYILHHHERWDGKGYPQGLAGADIPLLSRVLSIVDSYDAMTSDRVYRKAMSQDDAIAEIQKNAGRQFDPNIAEVFVQKVLQMNP